MDGYLQTHHDRPHMGHVKAIGEKMLRRQRIFIASSAIVALVISSLLAANAAEAQTKPYKPTAVAGTSTIADGIPSHIDTAHARPVSAPSLPAPQAGCEWVDANEESQYNLNLNMTISVLGEYCNGIYSGRASDHVCATPDNNSYAGLGHGVTIYNWWYADGNPQGSVQDFFQPAAGQTVCSYSGGFNASHSAEANGEFIDLAAPGGNNVAGLYGVFGSF